MMLLWSFTVANLVNVAAEGLSQAVTFKAIILLRTLMVYYFINL